MSSNIAKQLLFTDLSIMLPSVSNVVSLSTLTLARTLAARLVQRSLLLEHFEHSWRGLQLFIYIYVGLSIESMHYMMSSTLYRVHWSKIHYRVQESTQF